SFFFFFQAEDGIRDKLVTGVQTCALPICVPESALSRAMEFSVHVKERSTVPVIPPNSISVPAAASNSSLRSSRPYDLLLGALPLLFAANLFLWNVFFPEARRGHADFRQLYVAGYMVRTGQSH